ncbi:MAG TPA: hypothetical protein VF331_01765 [Polyangiales bacterium]
MHQRFAIAFLQLVLAVLVSLPARPLAAQASAGDASRDASARALFEDGVQLAEQAQWQSAEDRFRRALALRNSPVIAYNLANALAERGKLIEASELLRKLEHDEKLEPGLRQSVSTLQTDLTRRIGRLTVNVHGSEPADVVKLDDVGLLEAQLGVAIPVDPGAHRLSLERAGKTLDSQTVQLADGASTELTLQPLVAPSPAAVAAATEPAAVNRPASGTPAPAQASTSSRPVTKTWWFWTSVGVVGAAAVVVVAVLASSSGSSASGQTQNAYHGDFNPASLQVEVAR